MDSTLSNAKTKRPIRMSDNLVAELNGRVPPQAIELEKSVLGAMMLDQEALYSVIDKVHEGLFYKTEHQLIMSAIRRLVSNNHEVDILTVTNQLLKDGNLESAGGAYYISVLTNNVVSAAHIEYHVHILAEKYMKREIIRTSTESIRDSYDDTTDAIELLDKTEKKLMEVNEMSFKGQSRSLENLVNEAEKIILNPDAADDYGVLSGFVDLDRMTSGFQPGSLIILAARPAMGKTACGLSMARNIAVDFKKPVAYFSLEMTGVELLMRLVSSEAGIKSQKLKKVATMAKSEKDAMIETLHRLRDVPLYIDDSTGIDIFELRAKCRRLKQQHGIRMVFIDYLQLMNASTDAQHNRNREQEISNISRQLKEMAKELDIPVLAMAQLNRKVDERPMGIPQLNDLRESGSIEQDADIVIFIHRPYKYGQEFDDKGNSTYNLANLRVEKHRAGENGVVHLRFEPEYVRFMNQMDSPNIVALDNAGAALKPNENFDTAAAAEQETEIPTEPRIEESGDGLEFVNGI